MRKDRLVDNSNNIQQVFLEHNVLINANHPFLANMLYFFTTEARLYFVMPFIGGGEMSEVLKKEKKLSEKMTKFYVIQLVLGLKELHDNNIMHRNLKLEHLMIGTDGYLKIVDFGLARVLSPHENYAITIVGTPAY